jgi:hypothetical protein
MSRAGRMSIEDHRAWIAEHLHEFEVPPFNPVIAAAAPAPTSPLTPRPSESAVQMTMARLAVGVGRSEADLVKEVVARVSLNDLERARVEQWAREALTVVAQAAGQAAQVGAALTSEVLFHELASRWSPAYGKALETTPARRPSEMLYKTVIAARDDIKNAGLRLQQLADIARSSVAGGYTAKKSGSKWRVRADGTASRFSYDQQVPLEGDELDAKRAEAGLAPLERVPGTLMRDGDLPRKVHLRIESEDPKVRELAAMLEKMGIPVPPPGVDNYTAVYAAHVTGEVEYEPVRSGPRSRKVMQILEDTRLLLDVRAARAELARLEQRLDEVTAQLEARKGAVRTRVGVVTSRAVSYTAGSRVRVEDIEVLRDGEPFVITRRTTHMKVISRDTKTARYKTEKKIIWVGEPWAAEEKSLLEIKGSLRIFRHLRRLAFGERGGFARLPDLALARVGAAALNDDLPKDRVRCQHLLCLGHVARNVDGVYPNAASKPLFQVVEVRAEVVDAEGSAKVRLVLSRKKLRHVAKVTQPVVDRRGSQHKQGLGPRRVVQQVVEPVVTRRSSSVISGASAAGIAEVMSFVDHHHVGKLSDPPEPLREVARAAEVRVAEDGEVAEVGVPADTADVR